MFLKEFNSTATEQMTKINNLLKSEFGVSIKTGIPSHEKLVALNEKSKQMVITLRNSGKKFQLDPEYAKFLGIRDVTDTMLQEGMYAKSPAYEAMCGSINERVRELMDGGCSDEEACQMCMHDYRADSGKRWPDDIVMPIVLKAAKDYVEECGMKYESVMPETDLNQHLLSALAETMGLELETLENYDAIEEKLESFAKVSGKSRDAIVGFLNGLEEGSVASGIEMFGKKIAQENFALAAADAKARNEKEFEYPKGSGKMHKTTMDKKTADKISDEDDKKNESMFNDILSELITEEVDVEQAEVVMAVRALADDIQDQVERIGRMMNEDLPAIADQMRAEMGASQAQSFADSVSGLLSGHLEASKSVKSGLDDTVASLTGDELVAGGGLGDTGDLGGDDAGLGDALPSDDDLDLGSDMEDPIDNVPAASGPEEEPLGRAEI